jgi:hypothetical protein
MVIHMAGASRRMPHGGYLMAEACADATISSLPSSPSYHLRTLCFVFDLSLTCHCHSFFTDGLACGWDIEEDIFLFGVVVGIFRGAERVVVVVFVVGYPANVCH